MKPHDILDAIGEADARLVTKAHRSNHRKKRILLSAISLAACLVLLVGGLALGLSPQHPAETISFPEIESHTVPMVYGTTDMMEGITAEPIGDSLSLTSHNTDITDFALRLFTAENKGDENTLLSPLSVLYALGMTANGADGKTLTELETVTGMTREEMNLYLLAYSSALPQGEAYRFTLANSVWIRDMEDLTVYKDFLQRNANYYGAQIYKAPFDVTTLRDINKWVKDHTEGMIPGILDQIPDRAVMYLINALAFEADWEEEFPVTEIEPMVFTSLSGERVWVDMMKSTETAYLNDKNARGFLKYFKDGHYAFAALLPEEGMTPAEYLATLDGESLLTMLASPVQKEVEICIPRFEAEYETELSNVLQKMGCDTLFDPDTANLSELGHAKENLFASRLIHKTYLAFGETGARAGAATAVEIKEDEGITEIETIYFNRPFVYMLFDTQTGIPFFIGTAMHME